MASEWNYLKHRRKDEARPGPIHSMIRSHQAKGMRKEKHTINLCIHIYANGFFIFICIFFSFFFHLVERKFSWKSVSAIHSRWCLRFIFDFIWSANVTNAKCIQISYMRACIWIGGSVHGCVRTCAQIHLSRFTTSGACRKQFLFYHRLSFLEKKSTFNF